MSVREVVEKEKKKKSLFFFFFFLFSSAKLENQSMNQSPAKKAAKRLPDHKLSSRELAEVLKHPGAYFYISFFLSFFLLLNKKMGAKMNIFFFF